MINPNSSKTKVDSAKISEAKVYPLFTKKLELKPFRHSKDIAIDFRNPITAICGTNRSGKSTMLMALACSHLNFQKRNPKNGILERQTWSSLMKFILHDKQIEDWTYYITNKVGKGLAFNSGTHQEPRRDATREVKNDLCRKNYELRNNV